MQLTQLAEEFRALGYPAAEGESMAAHTSFKIGGPADLFVTVPDGASAADAGSATSSAASTAAAAAKIFLNKRITCHSPFYGGRRRFMPVSTAAAARRLPLPYPF